MMKRRWRFLSFAIVSIALAVTAWWWLPPLLGFAQVNSDLIQALEALLAIIFGLGGLVSGWLGLRPASSSQSEIVASEPNVSSGGGDAVSGNQNKTTMGDVTNANVVIGDGNVTTVDQRTVNNQVNTPELEALHVAKGKTQYLEAMKHTCQALNITSLGKEANEITLDQIYIDLDTTETEEIAEKGKEKAGPEPGLRLRPGEETRPLAALKAVARSKKLVLLGAPGAGKSTFVKKICGWLAHTQLDGIEPPPGISPTLIPVILTLRDLSQALRVKGFEDKGSGEQKKILLAAFKAQLGEELARLDAHPYLDSLLETIRKGKCLLVLDGLDEVPYDLRLRIRQFVGVLNETYAPERLIVTCRIRSYSGSTEIPGLERYTLAPFNQEKIDHFVQAWYNAFKQHYTTEQIKFRKEDLTRAALAGDLVEMASNPMLLTVMAIIHQEDVHLPPEKVKLYQRAVEILLRRWQKQKTGELSPSSQLEAFLKDNQRIYPALERLAYEAHRARREGSRDAPELLRKDALDLLERNECQCEDGYLLANEFLDYIDQRAGLLIGKGEAPGVPASYSFPHRTFQEYLAGCYLASQRHFFRALRPLAGEGDTWDLVAEMAFEELYHNSRGGVFTLLEASYDLCSPCAADDEAGQRLTLWAGQIGALIGKKEYEKDRDKPEDSRRFLSSIDAGLIQAMSGCLPPVERAEAGQVLARLGDPREEVLTIEAMQFCFIPKGPFQMGEDEERKTVDLPAFWLARYPLTNAQFEFFIKDGGYAEPRYWVAAKKAGWWKSGEFTGRMDDGPRTRPVQFRDPFGLPNHPVVGVSWYEAAAFTLWLDELAHARGWVNEKCRVRLPRETEWEKAARDGLLVPARTGKETRGGICAISQLPANASEENMIANPQADRVYPWGNEFLADRANTEESGIGTTSAVGCFPGGASPFGLEDLAGNVLEWQEDSYEEGKYKSLRGGSWNLNRSDARCASRGRGDPVFRFDFIGFRISLSPPS
jgi:formylglycine-generating enzyme required for sulfatase activity